MAKSKLRWGGTTVDGRNIQSITGVSSKWSNNSFTWSDVALAVEIADAIDGVGYTKRKKRLDDLFKDEEKKKRFIHLVC